MVDAVFYEKNFNGGHFWGGFKGFKERSRGILEKILGVSFWFDVHLL